MESFEQTVSADNLTTSEAKHTVEAMVNNVLSEAMMNLDKKRGGGSATGNWTTHSGWFKHRPFYKIDIVILGKTFIVFVKVILNCFNN